MHFQNLSKMYASVPHSSKRKHDTDTFKKNAHPKLIKRHLALEQPQNPDVVTTVPMIRIVGNRWVTSEYARVLMFLIVFYVFRF